jgi:pilus assembly protein TadC
MRRVVFAAALIGVAVAVLVGGWLGLVLGLTAAAAAHRYFQRLEPAAVRRERLRAENDLPFAADLLAAALHAGLPTEHAVFLVADAIGGPVGHRLDQVARAGELGLSIDRTWSAFSDLAGGRRLAKAVARSAHSGAALVGSLQRIADDLRSARTTVADAAGRRAAVLLMLPLGLCFLPAFVFAGIVPVIVAVLGDVLRR